MTKLSKTRFVLGGIPSFYILLVYVSPAHSVPPLHLPLNVRVSTACRPPAECRKVRGLCNTFGPALSQFALYEDLCRYLLTDVQHLVFLYRTSSKNATPSQRG